MVRYKFFSICPACGMGEPYLHTHRNCSSYEEIDDDGRVYCKGCDSYLGFIADLEYKYSYHSDYRKGNEHSVIKALSLMSHSDMPISVLKKRVQKL